MDQPAQVTDNETITVSDTEIFPDVVDSESITVTDMVTVTTGLIITDPGSLPAGYVGAQYPATTFHRHRWQRPYTWSVSGQPPGLSIGSTTGVISGIPTTAGTYPITVHGHRFGQPHIFQRTSPSRSRELGQSPT